MPYYAAVVIVEAPDAETAESYLTEGGVRDTVYEGAQGVFIGDAWEVTPVNEHHRYERIEEYVNTDGRLKLRAIQRKVPLDPEFDTDSALRAYEGLPA